MPGGRPFGAPRRGLGAPFADGARGVVATAVLFVAGLAAGPVGAAVTRARWAILARARLAAARPRLDGDVRADDPRAGRSPGEANGK